MRTQPLLFSLLALPLFTLGAGACSQEVTVAPSESTFTTYDTAVHSVAPEGLEVVVLVDDSASSAAARPLFASRLRASLARWIGEKLPQYDHTDLVRVVVRGAGSGVEKRVAFLADAPANAWKTPAGELRDAGAFLDAVDAAVQGLPTSEGPLRFLDAILESKPSAGLRPRTVFLVATAHDDASTHGASDALAALKAFELPSFSVLVDARSGEPAAATDVQPGPIAARAACGAATPSDVGWVRGQSHPRLFAVADAVRGRAQWADLCAVDGDAGDLLLQRSDSSVTGQCLSVPGSTCTVFVAPPVSGGDELCARPELGLAPASPEARAHYARGEYASVVADRPLCAMRALGATDVGEGFRRDNERCSASVSFTSRAQPVNDSWVFLHCESTH